VVNDAPDLLDVTVVESRDVDRGRLDVLGDVDAHASSTAFFVAVLSKVVEAVDVWN
jgi:hypothetical protein